LLLFFVGCESYRPPSELFGLWRSNAHASLDYGLNEKESEFALKEFGKLYHYYSTEEFILIYLPSIDYTEIEDRIVKGLNIPVNDGGFVIREDYKVLRSEGVMTVISDSGKHELSFTGDGNCFYIDVSVKELFCKRNRK